MDAGGRATQEAKAENNYTTKALPSLNAKKSAAKMYSKDKHAPKALLFDFDQYYLWLFADNEQKQMVRGTTMSTNTSEQEKKHERNTFVFLTVFLAPILSVMIVGSYGFLVWISQMIFGPPTS